VVRLVPEVKLSFSIPLGPRQELLNASRPFSMSFRMQSDFSRGTDIPGHSAANPVVD